MSPTTRLDRLPYELLLKIFEFLTAHDDYSLPRVALVSRTVNEAATEVLYHTVSLDTERRLRLFAAHNLPSAAPLQLVRHLSLWTDYIRTQRDTAGLIVDACPNLLSVQARATVLTRHCAKKRSFKTAFVWLSATDWDRFLLSNSCTPRTGMDFRRTVRLHVHWLDYLRFADCADPRRLFSAQAFPSLEVLSGGLNVDLGEKRNAAFFVEVSRAILALPRVRRVLYLVHHAQLAHCAKLQACGDERLRVRVHDYAGDMDEALALWLGAVHKDSESEDGGVSVMSLKTHARAASLSTIRN